MALAWGKTNNFEFSLCDFLNAELVSDEIKDINSTQIIARVAKKRDNNWVLPGITLYCDASNPTKNFLGSNNLLNVRLIIIDIFATNDSERNNLSDWLRSKIKNGFRYYAYTYNVSNPNSPTKTAGNWVHVNFVSDAPVSLGQNVDLEDAHRYRFSINCDVNESE